jgi:hypothetical protein
MKPRLEQVVERQALPGSPMPPTTAGGRDDGVAFHPTRSNQFWQESTPDQPPCWPYPGNRRSGARWNTAISLHPSPAYRHARRAATPFAFFLSFVRLLLLFQIGAAKDDDSCHRNDNKLSVCKEKDDVPREAFARISIP